MSNEDPGGELISAEERRYRGIVDLSTDVFGVAFGAYLGAHAGTTEGVIGGAAGGVLAERIMKKGLLDLSGRFFPRREAARLGIIYQLAQRSIQARLALGKQIRSDGFFSEDERGRAAAEELLEGIYVRGVQSYQEMKLPYIANIWGAAACSDLSVADASLMLQYADELTYRGLVALALVGRGAGFALRPGVLPTPLSEGTVSAIHEVLGLARRQLVVRQDPNGKRYSITASVEVIPAALCFSGFGPRLYDVLGLKSIPDHDIEDLMAQYLR